MTAVKKITVQQSDAELRLDRWFKQYFPSVTHAHLQKWLRTGQVRIDGRRVKANLRLEPGQIVRIPPGADQPGSEQVKPSDPISISEADREALLTSILYQDEDLIVLNKPPGLAVQGGSKTRHHLDAMLDHLRFDSDERPRLVHRLDKDTSGVLMLARSRTSSIYLTNLFRERSVQKTYWALVVGVPTSSAGIIDSALIKGEGKGGEKVRVDHLEGKPAETKFRIIDSVNETVSWLELEPKTGRTHQLRVHCASIDTPVLGDGKYGGANAYLNEVPNTRKLHLHAQALVLVLPAGNTLRVEAPLSPMMAETWNWFGFDGRGI